MTQGGGYNLESLRSELRGLLKQVIHMSAYPRTVFSFQIFIVQCNADA